MRLTFDAYWPLLFLLVIPYLWWVQRWTVADLSPKHLRLSTVIRSALIALLTFALMQPVLYRAGSYLSVVYLLDVSQSVAPDAIQAAIDWIATTEEAGQPDHSRFIAFAANSMPFENLEELRRVRVANRSDAGSIDQTKTKIAEALDRAIYSFAPNHLKRLVLISDGNENSGNLAAVLPRLKAAGVPVYTLPLPARATRDIWVERIMAPASVTPEEQFPVEVHVYSQTEATADVEVRAGDEVLATRSVQLSTGLNRVAFETTIDEKTGEESGPIVLEARATVTGDPFPDNNLYRESAVVLGKPRVLYVEGYAPSARYLEEALTIEGFAVDVVDARTMPSTVSGLEPYDAIILSDVERNTLSDAHMQAVQTYVRELGGGFILAAGENSYGEDGYSGTPIEEVLPVTFETKKNEPRSVAMIVVLDRSGSMAGQNIELAKEATKAPLALLQDTDLFGVVAFDFNYYWPVRLQAVSNRTNIARSISLISPGGETNIFPALREAYVQLEQSTHEVKHVILLSDGQTFPEDFQGLARRMAEAKITVSTVAVGTRADRELLANIAMWGQGRTYYMEEPTNVPQVFSDETELATGKTLQEEPFTPVVKKTVEAFKGIDFGAAPQLLGYITTKSKPTSEVLLESRPDEPLLARWQLGLGKAVAFTSDVKDRWAAEWLHWDGYPKFWAQLVRETMRRPQSDAFDFRVARDGESAMITINAIQKDGSFRNNLQNQVRVTGPDQAVSVIDVPQVGPGIYETRVPMEQPGTYAFRAVSEDGSPSRVLAYSYPDEYHFYPPNTDTLRALSAETGGAFQPAGPEIFSTNGETADMPTALWPWLTAVALLLYLVDILLRRLRLFETSNFT